MKIFESLRMALVAIRGNALRSFLTALGIIIGVATVISVVALGQGSRAAVTQSIASLGTNLVVATANASAGAQFTVGTASNLQSRAPDIVAAMPVFGGSATLTYGSQTDSASLNGVSPTWLSMRGAHMAQGAFLTSELLSDDCFVGLVC